MSFFGVVFVIGYLFYFIPKENTENNSTLLTASVGSLYEPKKENIPLLENLKIPIIGVDATVESVGLTSAGAVDVPKGPSDAAWFDLGPRPGEIGSAVFVGHSGWKNGIPAVFDNLYKLNKGDKLYIESDKGVSTEFVVREIRTYGENDDASSVFISNDNKAHLNLITCEGIWNKAKKSYSNRLVVFADIKQ